MSRTLIVPDVHEQIDVLLKLEADQIKRASRVVFLGDFFDTWKEDERHPALICQWLKESLDNPAYTILFGNHDISYAFSGPFRCSGWTQDEATIVNTMLAQSDWRKFHLFTEVGKFLISHAGFHPKTMHFAKEDVAKKEIEQALTQGNYTPIWGAGYCRGGRSPRGGPVWLDWREEFIPFSQAQIVGHTYEAGPMRVKVYNDELDNDGKPIPVESYCIDNGLKGVLWVDDDTNEVEWETL